MKTIQRKINIFAFLIVVGSSLYFFSGDAYGAVDEPCVLALECVDAEIEGENGTICCGVCPATGEISSCAFHPDPE